MLIERLGVAVDRGALLHALTHRSYAYENGGIANNERLEFLGDAVLGVVVTDTLFRAHPELPESQLAKFRSAVVNAKACARVARDLGVGEFMLLGHGEETTGGRAKTSILADAMEAIIGAVHLDRGLESATFLVHRLFDALMVEAVDLGAGLDWKTSLQELCARLEAGAPAYELVATGPDHAKHFQATVVVGQRRFTPGAGSSKKDAEQIAARAAYMQLDPAADA
ncbi:MAG: ribonuclease III [Candidatus Nanopelagicales bacterium]